MAEALAKLITGLSERGGIKSREIAQLVNTTPETVSRWKSGKVDPQQDRLQKLLVLEWIVDELAEFYEPEQARMWLFKPHRLLAGQSPAQRLTEGDLDGVRALIAQLKDGAYV